VFFYRHCITFSKLFSELQTSMVEDKILFLSTFDSHITVLYLI